MLKGNSEADRKAIIGEMQVLKNSLGWQMFIKVLDGEVNDYMQKILTKQGLDFENRYSIHDIWRELIAYIKDKKEFPDNVINENIEIKTDEGSIGYESL